MTHRILLTCAHEAKQHRTGIRFMAVDLSEIGNSGAEMEQMDLKAVLGHQARGWSCQALAPGSEKQIFICAHMKSGT